MITQLSLGGFKSWKEIRKMRFSPITGLFGTNSSGKTSILQFLLMLKQTAESPDRAQAVIFGDEKTPVNLGTYYDTIHAHETPGTMQWRLSWELDKQLSIEDPSKMGRILLKGKKLSFYAKLAGDGERLRTPKMIYTFADHKFILETKNDSPDKYELRHEGVNFNFTRNTGRVWDLPGPVKCYGFPDQFAE